MGTSHRTSQRVTAIKLFTTNTLIGWTLLVGVSLVWNLVDEHHHILELAKKEAVITFNKDQAFRFWASRHGGLYVPATEETPPNPYLSHVPERDITLPSGKKLTLMNPAYALRQLMHDFEKDYGVKGHITSLKPLNPSNAPDAWERRGLLEFERGAGEIAETGMIDGKEYFRLIRPMIAGKPCLKCHAAQGYREGDVRGGVGVMIPLDPFSAIEREAVKVLLVTHGGIWALGFVGIAFVSSRSRRNTVERTRAEEALRESRERFSDLVETTSDFVWEVDAGHVFTYVSPKVRDILGYEPGEVVGKSAFDLIPPDEAGRLVPLLQAAVKFRGPFSFLENINVHKDGHRVLLEDSGVPFFDASGNLLGYRGMSRDVTELRHADEENRRLREFFQNVAESIVTGVWVADRDDIVFYVNKAEVDLAGVTPSAFVGFSVLVLFAAPAMSEFRLYYRRAKETLRPVRYDGLLIITSSGRESRQSGWLIPRTKDGHQYDGMICTVEDVTEQKKAEEVQRRLNRELRAISTCNAVLMRATEEKTLLSDICRIICDEAGYRMAWVGYAEHDEARTVRPVAWAGFEAGYLADAGFTWADTERGRGPTGAAARSGDKIYVQDIASDPHMTPWRENALQRGYRSSIALPLKDERASTFGIINIYSAEANAFTPDELRLLDELAGDLAFGITVLRGRSQRKQAEQGIALMNFALNNVREAAFLIDANARFRFVNEESCRILGYTRDELLGLSVADVDPDFPLERWPAHWAELRARQALTFEGRHRAKDGRVLPVEISANYVEYDGEGYNLALARDITERKRAEDLLRKRETELNEAQRLAHIGSWEWDAVRDVIWWSDEYYRIYGRDPGKPTPNYVEHLTAYTPDSAKRLDEAVKRAMETGEPYELDLELAAPTEATRWIVARGEAKRDADGAIRGLRGSAQNITERKAAVEALGRSQALIKNILESVDEGFIVIDREYRVLSVNKAFCRIVNAIEDRILGKPCYEVAHHSALPCFETGEDCPVKHTFETGASRSVIHSHLDTAGVRQYVEIKSYPIVDASGTVVSAIETVNDITEKRKLEEQLRQAQKMEAVGTLAGGVAHDFNNILTAIIGYANIVKMKMRPDDPLRTSVDTILSSAERAAHLTQGLLAFSRKQILSPKPVDLNGIVRGVDKLLRRIIGEDVDFTTELCEGELSVLADAGQIEQVLMNLATNARDAMPGGGTLTIATHKEDLNGEFMKVHAYGKPGPYALVSVSDTGTGMNAETKEKIFEPFFTTKELGRGTGLGLSIVYGIIKQHNGSISVYSEPGRGSTFRIYLPLLPAASAEGRAGPAPAPAGGAETILLAEDDRMVRELIGTILRDFGYRVIEAADGEEASMRFRERPDGVDLLIVDVIMPKKSGREFYDEAKAVKPGVKAVFMSGYTADIIHKKGIFDEGLEFVSKPISPHELLRKVRQVLDGAKK